MSLTTQKILPVALALGLIGTAVAAATAIDTDFMQAVEDTTKSLDSNLALKDGKAALPEARELEARFAEVEAFYVAKGETDKGVAFALKSRGLAGDVAKAVEAGDFAAAQAAFEGLVKSCKTCHDAYK